MASQKGMWFILALLINTHLFGGFSPNWSVGPNEATEKYYESNLSEFFCNDEVLKTNLFSHVDVAHNYKATQLLKVFDLGELNLSTPYLPFLSSNNDNRSEASLNLSIPKEWGGFEVHGGVTYHVENLQTKKTSSPQEHVIYVVSTKNISDFKWKPFVTLSYVRSQVRDLSKAKHLKIAQDSNSFSSSVRYANAEVLGTCCGVQPVENLSMILSYNYLKPLNKGNHVTINNTNGFDKLRTKSHSTGVDLKVDYAVRDGLNVLVKSEYLLPSRALKDSEAPILIEGHLVVTF